MVNPVLHRMFEARLEAAVPGHVAPEAVPRAHGLSRWLAWRRHGTLLVGHLPHQLVRVAGPEQRERARAAELRALSEDFEIGDDGIELDAQGWPTRGGVRVSEEHELGVFGRLHLLSRQGLVDAPVVNLQALPEAERAAIRKHAFVDVEASKRVWRQATALVE